MLLQPAVRSLLAKDGLLDVLYEYDYGGFVSVSSRRPCQAGLPDAAFSVVRRLHRLAA